MSLHINNRSSEGINVALVYVDTSCTVGGQPWRKTAWWVINPGQTLIPNAKGLNVDLTTGNRFAALYAVTFSEDKDWQGTGGHSYEIPAGFPFFNQCLEDNTNCTRFVDFEVLDFGGNASIITYLGPEARQIQSIPPSIAITPGRGSFFISGRGFTPGSKVAVTYNYFPDTGGVTTNSGSPAEPFTSSDGSFTDIVEVSTLLYPGHLDVEAVDETFGDLSAKVLSVPV